MNNQTGLILKVLVFSAALSVLIKYGGPALPLGATSVNALILVLMPTLILAIALWWRSQKQAQQNQ